MYAETFSVRVRFCWEQCDPPIGAKQKSFVVSGYEVEWQRFRPFRDGKVQARRHWSLQYLHIFTVSAVQDLIAELVVK
jgi:hypothetical protein